MDKSNCKKDDNVVIKEVARDNFSDVSEENEGWRYYNIYQIQWYCRKERKSPSSCQQCTTYSNKGKWRYLQCIREYHLMKSNIDCPDNQQ
eukprot:4911226-Ditylum_brightwellii.AAC.1